VIDKNGDPITDTSQRLGTGMAVYLYGDQDTLLDSIILVVPGDATGNGITDIFDVLSALDHIFGKGMLEPVGILAVDTSNSGDIDIFDVLVLLNHLFGKQLIW
jgi:hypothetical protein